MSPFDFGFLLGLAIGAIAGGTVGLVGAALCRMAARADEDEVRVIPLHGRAVERVRRGGGV